MNLVQTLGLRRGTVRVVPYQPTWAIAFEGEKLRLTNSELLHDCAIEHIGGTSIEGMSAKPIIDIAIGVEDAKKFEDIVACLLVAGYVDRGQFGRHGGVRLLQFSGQPDHITHHVHLLQIHDDNWNRSLEFRDILRSDALLASRFSSIKAELSDRYPEDRLAYLQGKERFIDSVHEYLKSRGSKIKTY